MKRLGIMLGRHRYLTLAAVALLVAAGAVAAFSGASFNYKTANPGNTFTAGILTHSNSQSGAILTVEKMVPGQSASGEVTIANTGDIAGAFSVTKSGLSDVAGSNGGLLSDVLTLKIEDVTGATPAVVWQGPIKDLAAQSLGQWDAGVSHSYRFTVSFPDGGSPADNTSGDNAYQGSSLEVQFDWTSVQI